MQRKYKQFLLKATWNVTLNIEIPMKCRRVRMTSKHSCNELKADVPVCERYRKRVYTVEKFFKAKTYMALTHLKEGNHARVSAVLNSLARPGGGHIFQAFP